MGIAGGGGGEEWGTSERMGRSFGLVVVANVGEGGGEGVGKRSKISNRKSDGGVG